MKFSVIFLIYYDPPVYVFKEYDISRICKFWSNVYWPRKMYGQLHLLLRLYVGVRCSTPDGEEKSLIYWIQCVIPLISMKWAGTACFHLQQAKVLSSLSGLTNIFHGGGHRLLIQTYTNSFVVYVLLPASHFSVYVLMILKVSVCKCEASHTPLLRHKKTLSLWWHS